MIEYLFCDLDETLIRRYNNGTSGINKYNIQAIKKLERKGIKLVITTARSPFFLNRLTGTEYNFDYIAWNGSEIYCGGKLIYSSYINKKALKDFLSDYPEFIKYLRVTYNDGNTVFGDIKGNAYRLFGTIDKKHSDFNKIIKKSFIDYSTDSEVPLFHLVLDNEEMTDFYYKIVSTSRYKEYFTFGRTSDITIDVTSINCNKGKAISNYLNRVRKENAEFAVIGDSDNDISMLDRTKYSFCMLNGTKNALKHSNYHVKNVAECINNIISL